MIERKGPYAIMYTEGSDTLYISQKGFNHESFTHDVQSIEVHTASDVDWIINILQSVRQEHTETKEEN